MLQYVARLVANFVCLLHGARQGVHCGFLELFHLNQLHAAAGDAADERSDKISKVTG